MFKTSKSYKSKKEYKLKKKQKPIEVNIYLLESDAGRFAYRVVVAKYGMRFDHQFKTLEEARKQKESALKMVEKYKTKTKTTSPKFLTEKKDKKKQNDRAKKINSELIYEAIETNISKKTFPNGDISYKASMSLAGAMEARSFKTLEEAQEFKASVLKKRELLNSFGTKKPEEIVAIDSSIPYKTKYILLEPNIRSATNANGKVSYLARVGSQNKTFHTLEEAQAFKTKHLDKRNPKAIENGIYMYYTRSGNPRFNVTIRLGDHTYQKVFNQLEDAQRHKKMILNRREISNKFTEKQIIEPMKLSVSYTTGLAEQYA